MGDLPHGTIRPCLLSVFHLDAMFILQNPGIGALRLWAANVREFLDLLEAVPVDGLSRTDFQRVQPAPPYTASLTWDIFVHSKYM